MSRSYKKAIIKDKGSKDIYWKTVRRVVRQIVKRIKEGEELEIPSPKSIINDYDYSDYTIDYEHDRSSGYFWYNNNKSPNKWKNKWRRK